MKKKDCYIKTVLGVKVDCTHLDGVLKKVDSWITDSRGKKYIVTPNPEMIVQAQKDEKFKQALNGADIAITDGVGLVWALRWINRGQKRRIKRITGIKVMESLCRMADRKNWKVFLLGGGLGVAVQASVKLKQAYQNLQIMGWAGSQNIEKAEKEEKRKLIKKINEYKPDLLFVAYGHGRQEKWIAENLGRLNVKVAMGIGGAFDYIVKPRLRAPKLMREMGLEWLWRLIMQPWRIKRQLALMKFVWLMLRSYF